MKRNSKVFGMLAAGILSAALLAGPALAADPEIRVGSYKGNTLEAGERSCLIIGPVGPEYIAESSNPEAITLERVLTYWVAVARAEGTAEITVTNADGTAGSLTLTVGTAEAADDFQKETSALAQADTLDLSANMDIRLEMVRLINHGGLYNLTMFGAYDCPDIARQAIDYWIESPGHYKTMLLEEASHVGTGVTFKNGKAYCYMVAGDPTSHNPYE